MDLIGTVKRRGDFGRGDFVVVRRTREGRGTILRMREAGWGGVDFGLDEGGVEHGEGREGEAGGDARDGAEGEAVALEERVEEAVDEGDELQHSVSGFGEVWRGLER